MGGFTGPRTIGGFTGPRTMGGFTGPRTMGGFTKHGGGSKIFDLNELDVSHGQMAGVDEQYVDQAAVKAGSTPTRSFKRKVESESLVPGLFGGGYYEKPDVPLAADEYDDQGNGRSPVKGNIFFGNSSFSAPSNSEQAGRVSFRASTPSEQDALRLHARTIKSGFTPTIFAANQLIHLFSKNGLISEALKLFDEMPERNVYSWNSIIHAHVKARDFPTAQNLFNASTENDTVTYNTMISGYANLAGCEDHAVKLFVEMRAECDGVSVGVGVDEFTLTTMSNLMAKMGSFSWGEQLHCLMKKSGNDLSGFAVSSLIDMYSKCGSFDDARRVFHEAGKTMVDCVSKNAIIAACCREGEVDLAESVFRSKPELNDVVSWNTMISGLTQNGHERKAIELFRVMTMEELELNEYSLASILAACCWAKSLRMGKEIHTWVLKHGMDSNAFVASGIVELYCKCASMEYAKSVNGTIKLENSYAVTNMIVAYASEGRMSEAKTLFDSLSEKNSIVLSAMITGYVNIHQSDEAFELFRGLTRADSKDCDALMLVNLLGACIDHAVIDPGKQIHACILRRRIKMDVKVGTALIDMYSKCGNIVIAKRLFERLPVKDLVLYNVMIAGYAHHGYEIEALNLLEEMAGNGIQPDSVTFVAVLSACRHSGLVETGERHFSSMTEDYGIVPEREHYACMIDLYGRANQLQKAAKVMENIPIEMDASILGAFINACKMNRNVELARVAEEKVLKMEGDIGARYVQLAGVYASEGKWGEMERVMKKMRGKEVKKLAGSSWVSVGNGLHSFTSSDRSHSETESVYAVLSCLVQELYDDSLVEGEFAYC